MAALNPTTLLHFLGVELGISHSRLEVTDDFLITVVRNRTLETFSNYYPRIHRVVLDVKEHEMENRQGMMRIPLDMMGGTALRNILKFIPDTYWRSREQFIPQNTDIFSQQMEMNDISAKMLKTTYTFYPPNIIDISPKNLYYQNVLIFAAVTHHKNFFTIPVQLVDTFKTLALIDVKSALFNIRKNFPNIASAFGSIEIDIESVSDMQSQRIEIEETLRKNFFKSAHRRKIYTG